MSLLRFGHALQLVGASFGPLFLVAGQGTGGFFDPPWSCPPCPQTCLGAYPCSGRSRPPWPDLPLQSLLLARSGPRLRLSALRSSLCRLRTESRRLPRANPRPSPFLLRCRCACLLTHLLILLLWLELLTAPQIYSHPQETLQTWTNTRTLMNSTRRLPLWKMNHTL